MANHAKIGLFAGAILALVVATGASAQDNKPTPRNAAGHPDLNGTWDNGGGVGFLRPQRSADGSICVAGCPAPPGGRPQQIAATTRPATPAPPRNTQPASARPVYKAAYQAKVADLTKRQVLEDPVLRCHNPGLPRIGAPEKIVQTDKQLIMLYDDVSGGFWRIVNFGDKHRADAEESPMGDSIAHWEGDSLVIEATKIADSTWITDNGAFHTVNMKVTERLTRVGDRIDYQARVDDPEVLTQPWILPSRTLNLTNVELFDAQPCADQDIAHMVDPLSDAPDSHHDNPR